MRFDHDGVYYRAVGEGVKDYGYRAGEPERMATGRGLVRAESPYFEFDPADRIGARLYLGRQVRRLRVPPDAVVARNVPMSQGGCYTFSADRVELLEIVEFAELMRELDRAGVEAGIVHLARHELPAGFRFPARSTGVILDGCLACDPLDFPAALAHLACWRSALRVGRLPARLDRFEAIQSVFEGLRGPPAAASSQVEGCAFFP